MNLTFTPSAWDDYQWFLEHDRKLLKRIDQLIQDALQPDTSFISTTGTYQAARPVIKPLLGR